LDNLWSGRGRQPTGLAQLCAQSGLRSPLAQAQQRDRLDAEIAKATAALNAMPTISAADRGASVTVTLLPHVPATDANIRIAPVALTIFLVMLRYAAWLAGSSRAGELMATEIVIALCALGIAVVGGVAAVATNFTMLSEGNKNRQRWDAAIGAMQIAATSCDRAASSCGRAARESASNVALVREWFLRGRDEQRP
jgi:hypothetical protein